MAYKKKDALPVDSLNKASLIRLIAREQNFNQKDVKIILDAYESIILRALLAHKRVALDRFGTFWITEVKNSQPISKLINTVAKRDPIFFRPVFHFHPSFKKIVKEIMKNEKLESGEPFDWDLPEETEK
jgi:nucleoid DNA-binding protein